MTGNLTLNLDGEEITLGKEDVEITSEDVPGWLVASEGNVTVALDITITDELKFEGLAREMVNRIQNLRKDTGLEVTDRIDIKVGRLDILEPALNNNFDYIRTETLANTLDLVDHATISQGVEVELEEGIKTKIEIQKA
jgi:isoleucyl-tRNA synthetase